MSKNNITLEKIDGIFDIHPPVEPSLSFLENSLILSGATVFTGFSLYLLWRLLYSSKGINQRKIKKLQKLYSDNNKSSHETIYQLCAFLRQGLKVNHIGKETELPEKLEPYKRQWKEFTNRISYLRYKNSNPPVEEVNKALNDSLFWLKVWP